MSEKWWDMSDDELDDLFREASDQVDVPFDSSAFDKLRHKMDSQSKPEPPRGFRRRWLLLLAGLFLLVGVGLVYRFESSNERGLSNQKAVVLKDNIERKNNSLEPENQIVIPKKSIEKPSLKIKQTAENNVDRKNNSLGSENQVVIAKKSIEKSSVNTHTQQTAEKKSIEKSSVKTQTTLSDNQKFASSDYQTKPNDKSLVSESGKETVTSVNSFGKNEKINLSEKIENQTKSLDNQSVKNLEISKKSFGNNNWKSKNKNAETSPRGLFQSIEGQNIYVLKTEESFIPTENISEETIIKTDFFGVDYLINKNIKPLFTNVQATDIQPFVDSLPRKTISPKFSKFGFRLVVAPDFSSIENLNALSLGGSLGLLVEYNISKKLILQTGLIYSNKKYGGSFDYYRNWPDWTKYHASKPTSVDGGCKMIDLPINLRLNLFQKPKQTWFVSSGVTSYLMMNENYAYSYAWGPQKSVDWSDETQYYLSVLNFSVGFEKQFSKHLSLQIEPYLKTPLKSVGRGGVNLYSSGLMFSTKYSF